jgi:hypothetical protein
LREENKRLEIRSNTRVKSGSGGIQDYIISSNPKTVIITEERKYSAYPAKDTGF